MHWSAQLTRKAAEVELRHRGVHGPALEALLVETGRARHLARVAVAIEHARAASGRDALHPLSLLLADMFGVGGRGGCEGASTERHPGLGGLGHGRKHAADGPAWSAAIADAVAELLATWNRAHCAPDEHPPEFSPLPLSSSGDGHRISVLDYIPALNAPVAFGCLSSGVYVGCSLEHIAPRWQYTIAREGLRRAAGLDWWFPHLPVSFVGQAHQWAAVVNELSATCGYTPLVAGEGRDVDQATDAS